MIIRAFRLQRDDPGLGFDDPNGWFIEATVGFQPLAAILIPGAGTTITGWSTPNGLLVRHPIFIALIGRSYLPRLGRTLTFIDVVPAGDNAVHIFAEGPWPTAETLPAKPEGES